MKVKIFYGPGECLRSQCAELASKSPDVLLFENGPHANCDWGGARRLVEQLRWRLPAETIDESLGRHAVAAALVLPEIYEVLGSNERRKCGRFAAQLTSHMTHNWVIQYPIFKEWAALLVEIMSDRGFTILVPDLNEICSEDAALLKAIYRLDRGTGPAFVLGFDPNAGPVPDADGITWSLPHPRQHRFILDFQALQGSEICELSDVRADKGIRRPLDAESIETPRRALPAAAGPIMPQVAAGAVRDAFRNFGFTAALGRGLKLLASETALDPLTLSDIHSIVAVSAHNRQFHSKGNMTLAKFLESHLRAALAMESRPLERCALLYRLAVVLGRRQGRLEEALDSAEQAILTARGAGITPLLAAYQEAWGRNIKAYALMKSKRIADSRREINEGSRQLVTALDSVGPGELQEIGEIWLQDAKSSYSLLAHNFVGIAKVGQGKSEEIGSWLQKANDSVSEISGSDRFESFAWLDFHRRRFQLTDALRAALRGLASARAERDAEREYYYMTSAADLCYRLGDAGGAQHFFEEAQNFRQRCRRPRSAAIDTLCALSLMHSGRLDDAQLRLEELLDRPDQISTDLSAQINAWLALVVARKGLLEESLARVHQAVDFAQRSGKRDILLRVAWIAGDSIQLLGSRHDAKIYYEKGLAIAEIEEATPSPAADKLAALLGLLECGEHKSSFAIELLRLSSPALAQAVTWWLMERLVRVLDLAISEVPDLFKEPSLLEPLRKLISAAKQREDCMEPLRLLLVRLARPELGLYT